jgi:feruloyl esterase
MEAQRFPADYDGIIAGAPANYWTRLLSQAAYDMQATEAEPASYIPASKVTAIANAVLKSCDASDGVTDGVVNDPRMCHFDPNTMVCKAGDSDSCLTQSQATALKKIYDGPHSANGEAINPGFSPGGEGGGGGWSLWVTGPAPHESLQYKFATNFFAYMLTNDPQWTIKQFNLDRDFKSANAKMASALNATDPNLNTFQKRGGKLIVYHGWSDAAIPPLDAIKYFETVRSAMGSNVVNSFARLYMAPGVQHCAGGDGPDSFGQYEASGSDADPQHNMFAALEQWVEKGVAPGAIIATHDGEKKITRPLCPYPQQARYKGTGDTNDAANFSCTDRK